MNENNLLLVHLALLLPPVAMAVNSGLGKNFVINVILTIPGYFSGIICNYSVFGQVSDYGQMPLSGG